MTKEDILSFFYKNSMTLGIKGIALVMLAAIVVAVIICLTYWLAFKGVAFNIQFDLSLGIILLISAVIMMMISSNIVISLGMVGALSIVRFRTAIKDSRDTIFIFWAIVEGLCVGSQNNKLAFETTAIIAVIVLLISYIPNTKNRLTILISGKDEGENFNINKVTNLLKENCKYVQVKSYDSNGQKWTAVIDVKMKHDVEAELKLIASIKGVPELLNFNIVSTPNL